MENDRLEVGNAIHCVFEHDDFVSTVRTDRHPLGTGLKKNVLKNQCDYAEQDISSEYIHCVRQYRLAIVLALLALFLPLVLGAVISFVTR